MKDYLIENLMGMCRYGCKQRVRADYCTVCEAAERLKAADIALVRLSVALAGGAAKTWDEVFDAAEAAEVLIDVAAGPSLCVCCQGTGWCEGSPAFTCPACKGSGLDTVPVIETGNQASTSEIGSVPSAAQDKHSINRRK